MAVGGEVLTRIVETTTPDAPERAQRDDRVLVEQEERKYYERLKAKYEGRARKPGKRTGRSTAR
jgi:hypothetical protein